MPLDTHATPATKRHQSPAFSHRFSHAFFERVPQSPGVFWFTNKRRKTLYVGRSKNLRAYLWSLKQAEECRRTPLFDRLACEIIGLEFTPCPDWSTTLLMEKDLRKKLQPHFTGDSFEIDNHLFVGLTFSPGELVFRWSSAQADNGDEFVFGPYKGRFVTQKVLCSLYRLLWQWISEEVQGAYPHILARMNCPSEIRFVLGDKEARVQQILLDFFSGANNAWPELMAPFTQKARMNRFEFVFHWLHEDLNTLASFFRQGPARDKVFRQANPLPVDQILGEDASGLLVGSKTLSRHLSLT